MWRKIFYGCMLILLSIGFCDNASASYRRIIDGAMFGVAKDTLSLQDTEAIALKKIDSLKVAETSEAFYKYPSIIGRYSFDDLACIKMYSLYTGTGIIGWWQDNYEKFLFNSCNVALYHFGGGAESFSAVMAPYLWIIIRQDRVLQLIDFYLNTLSVSDPYHIIDSFEDYVAIWETSQAKILWEDDEIESDKNLAKDLIKPIKIRRQGLTSEVELYTWEVGYGKIEYWHFKVTRHSFEVLERTELLEEMGPYKRF